MSTQMLDVKIYEQVANKLWSYTFRNQINIDYCHTAKKAFTSEDELRRVVRTWCQLNEKSYSLRYESGYNKPELFEYINLKLGVPLINTFQVLKYLEAIKYNIDITDLEVSEGYHVSIEETECYVLLEQLIDDLRRRIIEELPQYKEAKWASI